MPKDKILKKNRVGSLVAAHQAVGSVGAKLARDLLDSDCESCSGRRRTSHATAAERAADYVKRVREKVVARRLREQAAAEEGDNEEEETEVEVEDPDADHEPLSKRGPEDPPDGEGGLEGRVGTAFSLEGGAAGSAATRRKPTMEVILDSGASHNVMPRDIYQRLLSQGRATPLAPVEAALSFTTASGQSLKNAIKFSSGAIHLSDDAAYTQHSGKAVTRRIWRRGLSHVSGCEESSFLEPRATKIAC